MNRHYSNNKTLLVVGAGGFVGGFIADEGLRRGYDVWVGVRESTSREYLTDPRLKFIVFDYDEPEQVERALIENAPSTYGWDYIIWNLGATKCVNFSTFNLVNFLYPRTFVELLRSNGLVPEKFLYISSLSAVGPVNEDSGEPISSSTVPDPNTRYGLSKIKTETFLESLPDFPWIIFRPTGVYGPHEKDYLMMIKSIDSHFDFGVGFRTQTLTFIYVDDLVRAMFMALESSKTLHHKYIISEPQSYTQKEFRIIVAECLGKKFVIPVKLPLWMAHIASVVSEKYGVAKMKPMTLNTDKFKIMKQRNWDCVVTDAIKDFGFCAKVPLPEGIRRTVLAYKAAKVEKKFQDREKQLAKDSEGTAKGGGER